MYSAPHLVIPQIHNLHDIDVYLANGGYNSLRKVLSTMSTEDIINEVKLLAYEAAVELAFQLA